MPSGISQMSLAEELLLELRGRDYDLSRRWVNLAAPRLPQTPFHGSATRPSHVFCPEVAEVPESIEFDEEEKAFVFYEGGDVISAPLATNPYVLRSVTYMAWVKLVSDPGKNLAWILCQSPDYGWSRAVTLNDYRLGHVSVATSRYWDSGLGHAPINEWAHVAGVWTSLTECTAYLNGVRGETSFVPNNGKSADISEEVFLIGGRAKRDMMHNAAVKISDVSVFGRALSDVEVQLLYRIGRPSSDSCLADPLMNPEEDLDGDALLVSSPMSRMAERRASKEPPVRDDVSGLFWFSTGVNLYDIPDGFEWQEQFRTVQASKAKAVPAKKRVLVRHTSDAPTPGPESPKASRTLARSPSDLDKRADRATHTEAIRLMERSAGLQIRVQGKMLALFRFGEAVFAVDAACPHQGASLCEGEIGDMEDMVLGKRHYVRCRVHKFQFDLATGEVIEGSCSPLHTYKTKTCKSPDAAAYVQVGFPSLGAVFFCEDEAVDF